MSALIETEPELELIVPTNINIVCFRHKLGGADAAVLKAFNTEIMLRLQEEGIACVSDTTVHGEYCLRAAISARDARSLVAQPGNYTLRGSPGARRRPRQDSNLWPLPSAGQRRGPTAACATSLTSCADSEERTGIRFEKERVYGYSGGAKALPGRPLVPGDRADPGSRR